MTSSLVGSEMCIRDRAFEDGSWAGLAAEAANLGTTLAMARAARQGFKDCLLYTSDAADDM
eukprot:9916846-Prorocentrum_lima.AAC.1